MGVVFIVYARFFKFEFIVRIMKCIIGIESTAHTREVLLLEVSGIRYQVSGVCCAVFPRVMESGFARCLT